MPHSAAYPRRPTRAEVKARIARVVEWIAAGASRPDIVQLAAETWGVRTRQADAYIAAAHRRIDRALEKRVTFLVNRQVYQLRQLFGRALAAGDLRAALKALDQEARLLDLNPHPSKLTDRELTEALSRVLEDIQGQGQQKQQPGAPPPRP